MAARFISKTVLHDRQLVTVAGNPVLRAHGELQDLLLRRVGPGAVQLFAEPVVNWDEAAGGRTVSWYAEAPDDAEAFPDLPATRRAALTARLRDDLARLVPLLDDPRAGSLLRAALCVRAPGSLFAVGDRVVLTEWGVLPEGTDAPADVPGALGRSALAPFLPPPPAAPRAAPPAAATAAAPGAAPVPAPLPAPVARRRVAPAWFAVPLCLSLAALFLALGYWRGAVLANDRLASRPDTVSILDGDETRRAIAAQKERNAALERQVEERRRLLEGNVCLADPATMPRLGPDRAATPPPAVVPPPPGGQPFQGTLADLLKQSIVMVIAPGTGDKLGVGTGFFITTDLVLTNRHVVEDAAEGKVMIVNTKLGRPVEGKVIAATPNSDIGFLDAALIRVPAQSGLQPLAFSPVAAELDPVIAAGYPALITRSDAATVRLFRDGDLSAAPQLILTDGRIQAVQTSPGGIRIMPHGAAISGGNSGGPLVDGCGRVVGINTFIRSDTESSAHANYAIKSDSLLPFLKEHAVAFTEVGGPCAPNAPAAPPAAPPAAAR